MGTGGLSSTRAGRQWSEASWAFSEPPPALSCWDLVKQGVCCSVLTQDFSPCRLFHSGVSAAATAQPPRPSGEEAWALVSPPPAAGTATPPWPGSLGDAGSFGPPTSTLVSRLLVSSAPLWPTCPGPSGVADPWRLPQEPSQPLNLTAKPKASELPNSSSSPNLKLSNCGPRPPSHGAPTLDLQANPPSLPLGKPPAFPC